MESAGRRGGKGGVGGREGGCEWRCDVRVVKGIVFDGGWKGGRL